MTFPRDSNHFGIRVHSKSFANIFNSSKIARVRWHPTPRCRKRGFPHFSLRALNVVKLLNVSLEGISKPYRRHLQRCRRYSTRDTSRLGDHIPNFPEAGISLSTITPFPALVLLSWMSLTPISFSSPSLVTFLSFAHSSSSITSSSRTNPPTANS